MSTCKVSMIQASECAYTGTKIYTLELEYPRAIHAQLLTHRVFSKNSSSSRAVPIKTAIAQILSNPAKFLWTDNEPGMQGQVITDPDKLESIEGAVQALRDQTIKVVKFLGLPPKEGGLNVHKQNAARYLEPFQNIKICLTATEWENWDWLRIDGAAQGEIKELAEAIYKARQEAKPMILGHNEWHVPYVERRGTENGIEYWIPSDDGSEPIQVDVEYAIKYSMAMAAQTSYRKADGSDEKIETVIDRLFNGAKVHASPSEHQATPITTFTVGAFIEDFGWPKGVTHMDRQGNYWSANFKHFIQNRQLLPNHDKAKMGN